MPPDMCQECILRAGLTTLGPLNPKKCHPGLGQAGCECFWMVLQEPFGRACFNQVTPGAYPRAQPVPMIINREL